MTTIPLPAGLPTGKVTGRVARWRGADGRAVTSKRVTITPDTSPVQWRGTTPLVVLDRPIPAVLDEDGWLCEVGAYGQPTGRGVTLPVTEHPDLYPSAFTYTLTIHTDPPLAFPFGLQAGQVRDLATLEPAERTGGVLRVLDTTLVDRADAIMRQVQELVDQLGDQVILDPDGNQILVQHTGEGTYRIGAAGEVHGFLPTGALPAAAKAEVQSIARAEAPGVEEVTGTVTLASTGRRVREFYTTGQARIGGVTFPADTAVVFRRTSAGAWTYKTVTDWITP